MYTKNAAKPEGTYWKCTNPKCGLYWEAEFYNCNLCGHPTKVIRITEDESEEDKK